MSTSNLQIVTHDECVWNSPQLKLILVTNTVTLSSDLRNFTPKYHLVVKSKHLHIVRRDVPWIHWKICFQGPLTNAAFSYAKVSRWRESTSNLDSLCCFSTWASFWCSRCEELEVGISCRKYYLWTETPLYTISRGHHQYPQKQVVRPV